MADSFPWLVAGLVVNAVLTLGTVILVLGAYHEIRELKLRGPIDRRPPASRLNLNDSLPAELPLPATARAILLFLSYGCSGCAEICQELGRTVLGEWHLFVVIRGEPAAQPRPLPAGVTPALRPNGSFDLPGQAEVLYDRDGQWFRALQVRATPTAIALSNGRMVRQEVAPNIRWFHELSSTGRTVHVSSSISQERSVP